MPIQNNSDESDIDTARSPKYRTVFIDCEFTDMVNPELLSIGLVCDDGRELYVDNPALHNANGGRLPGSLGCPARRQVPAHGGYPCGLESCKGCCGAVASDRPLEDVSRLCRREDHPPFTTLAAARPARIGRVTAIFRMKRALPLVPLWQ
jgi:hypothetical protein